MLTKEQIEERVLGIDSRGTAYDKLIYDFCPSDVDLNDVEESKCKNWEKCAECWELARKEQN